MNKKTIISMTMPLAIQNKEGKNATLKLNNSLYIVCEYSNGERYSLKDVNLTGWYPSNKFRSFIYKVRNIFS